MNLTVLQMNHITTVKEIKKTRAGLSKFGKQVSTEYYKSKDKKILQIHFTAFAVFFFQVYALEKSENIYSLVLGKN